MLSQAGLTGTPNASLRAGIEVQALLADIAGTARREFLTDRVADLVALGAAFQRADAGGV